MATTNTNSLEMLKRLAIFRQKSFESFGNKSEFSDSMWFATWSSGSLGGKIARNLLDDSTFGLVKVLCASICEVIIQGFIRTRKPCFLLPINWLTRDERNVFQLWRNSEESRKSPIPIEDRFFGTFYADGRKNSSVAVIDILTNNLGDKKVGQSLSISRTQRITWFNFRLALYIAINLVKNIPSYLKLLTKIAGLNQKIAATIILFGCENQRSRHSRDLFKFLQNSCLFKGMNSTNIPTLYLPYESHPEQNVLSHFWQERGGKVVGYIHGTMLTFPGHYIKPLLGAPNELMVHGEAYLQILNNIGWEKSKIAMHNSFRFSLERSKSAIPLSGSVFFPYWNNGFDFSLMQISAGVKMNLLDVSIIRDHPSSKLDKKSRKFCQKLIELSKNSPNKKRQLISVGQSSVPLEELERELDMEIIHIPVSNSAWDSFDSDLWEEFLSVEKLPANLSIYKLKLKIKGSFIKFS